MKVWSAFLVGTVAYVSAFAQDTGTVADELIRELGRIGNDPEVIGQIKGAITGDAASKADPIEQRAAKISTDDKFWAYRPVSRPAVPAIDNVANPIDAFVREALQRANLEPSGSADKRTLIRRVYLDVLGLLPTPEEADAFVADTAPDAYERMVDRALASPHYGERWARHWLDVIRFAESHGFEMNKPRRNAWHYRDYVIDAFNRDMPYTQFVTEQLAGDTCDAIAATGFLVSGPMDEVKSPDIVLTKNQRDQELHDVVSTTAAAFLGLTLGCAKCHDHKFDPISQRDYYAMRAVFAGVQHGERELPDPNRADRLEQAETLQRELASLQGKLIRYAAKQPAEGPKRAVNTVQNIETFAPVKARFVRFSIRRTSDIEPCIDELCVFTAGEDSINVASAEHGAIATASSVFPDNDKHKTIHLNDGRYGNDYSWIPTERENAWAQIEFTSTATIDCITWGRDRDGNFRDRLALDYVIDISTDGTTWTTVASSEGRAAYDANAPSQPTLDTALLSAEDAAAVAQLQSREKELQKTIRELKAAPKLYAARFERPEPTYMLQRGDPMQDRNLIAPATLTHLGDVRAMDAAEPEQQRRLKLAQWICDERNPLTARVIVNRIWQYHFGVGIVDTPSDFGAMGSRPTHPELLDWLANALVDNGWSLKSIHKLILMSNTYRQSSAPNEHALTVDASSRLLWRFPPRRLEMEPIRDNILYVSGQLDLTMGGPGFDVFEPDDSYVHIYTPKTQFTRTEMRRMIYQWKPRMEQDVTFGIFDCPDASQTMPKRNVSTSPLQALSLLNSPFMTQQSEAFAQRVVAEAGTDRAAQVLRAFALAFLRTPTADEATGATALVEQNGLPALCRALVNASEFVYLN